MNKKQWETYKSNENLREERTQETWLEELNKRLEQAKKGWAKLKALKDEWLKKVEKHNEKEIWRA